MLKAPAVNQSLLKYKSIKISVNIVHFNNIMKNIVLNICNDTCDEVSYHILQLIYLLVCAVLQIKPGQLVRVSYQVKSHLQTAQKKRQKVIIHKTILHITTTLDF